MVHNFYKHIIKLLKSKVRSTYYRNFMQVTLHCGTYGLFCQNGNISIYLSIMCVCAWLYIYIYIIYLFWVDIIPTSVGHVQCMWMEMDGCVNFIWLDILYYLCNYVTLRMHHFWLVHFSCFSLIVIVRTKRRGMYLLISGSLLNMLELEMVEHPVQHLCGREFALYYV